MAGLPLDTLHVLLNEIGERIRAGANFRNGDQVNDLLEGGYWCGFRAVHPVHFAEYVGQALRYYDGDRFRLLQCFWPDNAGRLPWEDGFDATLGWAQPRLDLPPSPSVKV